MKIKERNLLYQATDKLQELTGAAMCDLSIRAKDNHAERDGTIALTFGETTVEFYVEIKNEVRGNTIPVVQTPNFYRRRDTLLICGYITKPMKDELRHRQINYLELAGNCYIQTEGIYIYINDQQVTETRTAPQGKLWKTAGIKFLFALLNDPELLRQPYRTVADRADIALGNVGALMDEMGREGYLKEGLNKTAFIERREELFGRWAEAYRNILRPKITAGTYRFVDKSLTDHWKELQPKTFLWGGENAGALLTDYLRPEKFTIYAINFRQEVMKELKLLPDPEGPVEILHQFWKDIQEETQVTVPPLLAYADLATSLDSRNRETAERLKKQYLD
ncbi:type IV toxin-antitoxin system AbiEi family antitoxin [Mucilaginibacter polytrichastri]|nr:type IV toxin-antitoxin system AbiEi family antitoxin [Mucilaginibacter polytrichastri]SFS49110.1 hypothetical protein SAMN04487890_101825 [Mucilaginibacter polytrichastri]